MNDSLFSYNSMVKWCFILSLFSMLFLFRCTSGDDKNYELDKARQILLERDPSHLFITKEGNPTPPLIELLKLDGLYEENDTLADIVQKTQEKWVAVFQGRGNKERTDLQDTTEQQEVREKVEAIARSMGLFAQRKPALAHYDYGVCLGSFLDGVRMHLRQLVRAWEDGVRFDSLVFLTGERYLRKNPGQQDDLEKLKDQSQSPLPFKQGWNFPESAKVETEYDMVKIIWDQIQLPKDMAEALEDKVVFVNAPRGSQERPSTKDTYELWLKEFNPPPGTVLAASYPMLWTYQQLAGENVLGRNYPLDTIAPAVTEKELDRHKHAIVSLVHDTVAKCLYEINEYRE